MKNLFKHALVLMTLLTVAGYCQAQSQKTAEQAKLPSNRPMPERNFMIRKTELMRAKAPKPVTQDRQVLQVNPADIKRPSQKPSIY